MTARMKETLLKAGMIEHDTTPAFGPGEFKLTDAGCRAAWFCSNCDEPVGEGAERIGPAGDLWCKKCLMTARLG